MKDVWGIDQDRFQSSKAFCWVWKMLSSILNVFENESAEKSISGNNVLRWLGPWSWSHCSSRIPGHQFGRILPQYCSDIGNKKLIGFILTDFQLNGWPMIVNFVMVRKKFYRTLINQSKSSNYCKDTNEYSANAFAKLHMTSMYYTIALYTSGPCSINKILV